MSATTPAGNDIYVQAIYPFQGDARAHQLTFSVGTVLRVPGGVPPRNDGWTWGILATVDNGRERQGWFPTGYAVLTSAPVHNKNTLPWIPQDSREDDDDGQFLGGRSPALDYSSANPTFRNDPSNPFATTTDDDKDENTHHDTPDAHGGLDRLPDNDRITIVAVPSGHGRGGPLGRLWPKGRRTTTATAAAAAHQPHHKPWRIPHRHREPVQDPMRPSIAITPSPTHAR